MFEDVIVVMADGSLKTSRGDSTKSEHFCCNFLYATLYEYEWMNMNEWINEWINE